MTWLAWRWISGALVGAVCMSVLGGAVPAVADTAPLSGQEWWFDAWRVQAGIWPRTQGAGVTVAILDSGVAAVPDLAGAVLPGYDTRKQGGDGRQDIDAHSHGTRMASLIAARGTTTGMLGIAPLSKILPVTTGDSAGHFTDQEIADAIRWSSDHGARVLNMSFAVNGTIGGCPKPVQEAVQHAIVDKDAVLIGSAGNTGDAGNPVEFPAACSGVVAVGAVDRQARPWPKSQRQPYVDVAAPGVDMAGIDRTGRLFVGASGTSDSAALTSAGVALIRSAYPQLSGRQVVARLLATLRDRPAGGGKDPQRGYGTIRLDKAVNDPVPVDAPNPVYDELQAGASAGAGSGSAGPSGGPISSGPAAGTRPAGSGGATLAVIAAVIAGALVLGGVVVLASRRRRPLPAPYPAKPTYRPPPGAPPHPPAGQGQPRPPPPQWPS